MIRKKSILWQVLIASWSLETFSHSRLSYGRRLWWWFVEIVLPEQNGTVNRRKSSVMSVEDLGCGFSKESYVSVLWAHDNTFYFLFLFFLSLSLCFFVCFCSFSYLFWTKVSLILMRLVERVSHALTTLNQSVISG